MGVLGWAAVLILSLAVLVKGADLFVGAAVRAGNTLEMPPFLIGVVLVGFGTSLPELVSSVLAVPAGSSEIVIGNVLGSNITNVLLVLGLAGLLGGTFRVKTDLLRFDLPVMAGGAFLLGLMIEDGDFTTGEGVTCLLMLVVYLVGLMRSGVAGTEVGADRASTGTWILLLASPVLIFLGAKYTVTSVTALAVGVGVGADVLAMSAVALGTSLPEVVVAVTATRRGQPELVVGNIVGSNIFNTFAVMGIPALLGTLTIPASAVDFSLPVFIAVTMLHVIITVDRRVTRSEGAFLLVFYLFFIGRLFNLV